MTERNRKVSALWEQHEREQQRARLSLTYRERLRWLNQAKAFVRAAAGKAGGRGK